METTRKSPQGAQLIGRAAALLRAIPRGSVQGRRLQDLASSVGLSQPTVHRILKALAQEGLVHQDRRTKLYRLGPLTFELGLVSNPLSEMIAACRSSVRDLAHKTGDTSFLCVRSGADLVCMDRADGGFPIRASMVSVGERLPLGLGALGISLLSVLPDREIDEMLASMQARLNEFSSLSAETVRERIRLCRRDGYAYVLHHPLPEVHSVGCVVPFPAAEPTFGLATVAIESRYTPDHVKRTIDALRQCARSVAATLERMS